MIRTRDALLSALLAALLLMAGQASAQSDNVTKCYVRGSPPLMIRNGQTSAKQCQDLAVRCTGNAHVVSTFNSTPTILHQTYDVCGLL